jgi:hypothetical protein
VLLITAAVLEANADALRGPISRMGALATPLASALAFIEPGLAKDADCGGLLAEARRYGAPAP